MADGQPRTRLSPYRETFWIMALCLLAPIAVAMILLFSFKALTLKGALLAGDVASSHAQIELACEKCHTAWQGPTDAKCQACHSANLVRDHAPGWNLPVDHGGVKMTDCKHCHVDHHGRNADLKAQASMDCILCHGFKSTGEGHPEVRMVEQNLFAMLPQSGFRQFKHSDHVNLSVDRSNPNAHKLDCNDCHTFRPGGRVLITKVDKKFDESCKSCHSDQLSWSPSRRAEPVVVTHPNKPPLADNPTAGTTAHDAFVAWSSDQKCGQCHYLVEKFDPNNPKNTIGFDVAPTRIESESTWVKLQHWGYGEFSHQRHMDPKLSGAAHPLQCTDCHQSSDQFETIGSPTFEKHCIQCHSGDTELYLGRNVPKATVKHPQVPVFPDSMAAADQLAQSRQWAGRDPATGQPMSLDTEEGRKCAKCHSVREQQGGVSLLKNLQRLAYGAHYAGLDPLLAQASGSPAASDSATASASPAATDTSAASASPAATDTSAASAAPAANDTTASTPMAAVAPTPDFTKLTAPLPLPEDKYVSMGKVYQVRVIAKVAQPVSLVTHFVHKPHITSGIACSECHKVNPAKDGQIMAGGGYFDMQLLPNIAECAKCHNPQPNGVGNECGLCHDFHDNSRHDMPVILSPQSQRSSPDMTLAARLKQTWPGH